MSLPPIKGLASSPSLTESMHRAQRRRNVPIVAKGLSKEPKEDDDALERPDQVQGEIRKGGHTVVAGSSAMRRRNGKKADPGDRSPSAPRRISIARRMSKAPLHGDSPTLHAKLRAAKPMLDAIPPTLLHRAKELFYEFDADGNGVIDSGEVRAVMRSLGHELQAKDIQQMLDLIDKNKSSNIDLREFLEMLQECNSMDLFRGQPPDVSNAISLARSISGNQHASAETSIDAGALKKILAEDFDLQDFRLEEVLPGPITFGSLQMFLCDGKA